MSRQGAGTSVPAPLAYPGCCVACGAAGVPGAGGPGRCVCRWAAARPRVVRAASFARPAREPSAPRASLGASSRSPAMPRHRLPAPQQVPTPPVGPASVLAHIAVELPNFACNSPTTLSNPEMRSLELQRFLGLLKFVPIELHAKFVWLGSCHRLSNFARNSPATCLDIEVVSLGLQRFRVVSKSDREKLCAKFVWTRPRASNPVGALWILRRTSHLWGLVCCCVG